MNIRNRRQIRQSAAAALKNTSGNPRMVVLIYGGVICLLALIANIVTYYLDGVIAETGGLSNMGLRSILTTIQMILPLAQILASVGLEVGYCIIILDVIRGRSAQPRSLLQGFRRFLPAIVAGMYKSMVSFAVVMGAIYLSFFIYMMTPAYDEFFMLMEPHISAMTSLDYAFALDDATLFAAADAVMPMMWIFAVVGTAALAVVMYQYRMTTFCIADAEHPRALLAMADSRRMMQGNRFALFRLDLSLWWYYLLQTLVMMIGSFSPFLPLLGVTLPYSDAAVRFLFFLLSLALRMVIFLSCMNYVTAAYATAYETLKPEPRQSVPLGNIFDM